MGMVVELKVQYCREKLKDLFILSMLFKNCNKTFLLLTETTGEILQTNLRSYLKIVQRKNVLLVSNEF